MTRRLSAVVFMGGSLSGLSGAASPLRLTDDDLSSAYSEPIVPSKMATPGYMMKL